MLLLLQLDSTHYTYPFPEAHAKFQPYSENLVLPRAIQTHEEAVLLANRYRNAANYVDSQLARVIDALKKAGVYEDTAIVLGQAIRDALGDKRGISRFGDALVPLDDALAQAVVDPGRSRHRGPGRRRPDRSPEPVELLTPLEPVQPVVDVRHCPPPSVPVLTGCGE